MDKSNFSAGLVAIAQAAFTRPADTTAYASGDLVANDTTAGNVVPLEFQLNAGEQRRGVTVLRARISKSGTGTSGATFRLHLFRTLPTVANGDNGALSATGSAGYLGVIEVTMRTTGAGTNLFSDGAAGVGVPSEGYTISTLPAMQNGAAGGSTKLYGLLEAGGAYTPASGETFTVSLEGVKD